MVEWYRTAGVSAHVHRGQKDMPRDRERALQLSPDEQELIDRLRTLSKSHGPFTLTIGREYGDENLFLSSEDQIDSESDDNMASLRVELQKILEQAARINRKAERLREVTEDNSKRLTKIEEDRGGSV